MHNAWKKEGRKNKKLNPFLFCLGESSFYGTAFYGVL